MSARKPLFSRQQLNWIIIILTIVIALLSLAPEPTPWPHLQRQDLAGVDLLAPQEASDQAPLVRVVLRLPPYLDADSPVAASLEQLLVNSLEHAPVDGLIQRHRLPDRLRLTLKADRPEPLLALLEQLHQRPQASQMEQATLRLTAALRLADHRDLPAIWPAQPVSDGSLTTLYDNWLSRAQLSLIFNQPLTDAQRQPLREALSALPAGSPWSDPVPPLAPSTTRTRSAAQYQLQLVRELPGRRDPGYEQTLLAVRALQPLAAAAGIQLDWQPRRDRSRLGLIHRSSDAAEAETLLAELRQRVAAEPIPAEAVGAQTLTQLQHNLAQPLGYLDLLETIASYRLPVDALARFAATLEQQEAATLRRQMLALLDSAAFHRYAARPLNKEPDAHAP